MFRYLDGFMMPAKKGFCWCLGGTAPPEISYGLDNRGMTLKPIEADIPMPEGEGELDSRFSELVVSIIIFLVWTSFQFYISESRQKIAIKHSGVILPPIPNIQY